MEEASCPDNNSAVDRQCRAFVVQVDLVVVAAFVVIAAVMAAEHQQHPRMQMRKRRRRRREAPENLHHQPNHAQMLVVIQEPTGFELLEPLEEVAAAYVVVDAEQLA